jgi:excisionase family DNA binding protein
MYVGPTTSDLLRAIEALRAEVRYLRDALPSTLVDLPAAAKAMNVSPWTFRRYVAAGTVPFRRVGRTLRLQLSALKPRTITH